MTSVRTAPALDREYLRAGAVLNAGGIREEAFRWGEPDPRLGILHTGDNLQDDLGFVICHSYGLEFLTLRRMERAIARTLAAGGHPVLSFHGTGYGDSEGSLSDSSLETHVCDVLEAASELTARTGVRRFGLIGARFGGLVAAMAAGRLSAERLVLIDPALSGAGYFKRFLREMAMVSVAEGRAKASVNDLKAELESSGELDVLGHPLYQRLYEQASAVDLSEDAHGYSGAALLINVTSARATPPKAHIKYAERLGREKCELRHVALPPGLAFAGPAYMSTTDPTVRVDRQAPLNHEIAELVEEWMA